MALWTDSTASTLWPHLLMSTSLASSGKNLYEIMTLDFVSHQVFGYCCQTLSLALHTQSLQQDLFIYLKKKKNCVQLTHLKRGPAEGSYI